MQDVADTVRHSTTIEEKCERMEVVSHGAREPDGRAVLYRPELPGIERDTRWESQRIGSALLKPLA